MTAITAVRHGGIEDMQRAAENLESDNPLLGIYSRQFVAFPRFSVPKGTVVTAGYPSALPEEMRQVEHLARVLRAMKTGLPRLPGGPAPRSAAVRLPCGRQRGRPERRRPRRAALPPHRHLGRRPRSQAEHNHLPALRDPGRRRARHHTRTLRNNSRVLTGNRKTAAVKMTVDERDQWEYLRSDQSPLYLFQICQDQDDPQPFLAIPSADSQAVLKAASPCQLRALTAEDHARREGRHSAATGDTP